MNSVCFSIAIFLLFWAVNHESEQMETGDRQQYGDLVWSDDFDYENSQLDVNWNSQNGPSGHILCSRWRENALVENGNLYLKNKKENRGGQKWTSASIWTKKQFQYGYFECRYKYAATTGTNNSFWIMTTDVNPVKGKKFEIDVNEGHYPSEMNTNVHNWSDVSTDSKTGKTTHPSDHKSFDFSDEGLDFSKEYHVFGLKWTSDSLIYSFDGKDMRRMKNEFCHSPAPVYLSEAIISWAGAVTDAIDGTSMVIDWVRIYQLK